MNSLSKKQLQAFSEQEHKKHKIQALLEIALALTPLMIFSLGITRLTTTPQGVERMSPANFGVIHILIILATISYITFLYFIIKDIRKRLAIR